MLYWIATTFTIMHVFASVWKWPIRKTTIDIELVRQHHEKCAMLGIVALAILGRVT